MKANFKNILLLVVMVVAIILAVSTFNGFNRNEENFDYSDLVELFEKDLVYSFTVNGDSVITVKVLQLDEATGQFKKDDKGNFVLEEKEYAFATAAQREFIHDVAVSGQCANLHDYDFQRAQEAPWYQAYLPYIIVAVIFIALWFVIMKTAGGAGGKMNSFAKSKAKLSHNDKDAVKFADVAGADEEKAELEEVVEFLKDPSKFIKLGARIPRGVLLVGPPGTGKTLLAKAVAGEAGVPFFSISGSDFVEMYVGVGASRVRDLFDNARKTPASIIFIDEIDAVGRHRGAGLGGGHDEREQTLNQLLVEMDGFGTNSGVIVMAATNRPDILDPALLRPGRFDRRITVNYPDMKGREAVLKVHCRNKPLEETVDLGKIAQTTIGFTGAELANLMNEAALLAAKKNKALIGMEDIEESYMKILLGPQKKSKVRTEADNKLCAYHEAGHAVASYFCEHTDPVKHITIIPAGNAGGVTLSVPTEDRMGATRNEMLDDIVMSLGGRVAEALILDDISTGASGDIQHATRVARNMITRYGMSNSLGAVLYGSEHSDDAVFLGRDFSSGQNYSEKTAAEIDDEIRRIVKESYDRCEKILKEHIDKLHFVANFLLKNEFMDEDQFLAAMQADDPDMDQIEAIAAERRRKSEEENRSAALRAKKREEEERLQAIAKEREMLAFQALAENRSSGYTPGEDVLSDLQNEKNTKDQSSDNTIEEKNSENNTDSSDGSNSEN